MKPGDLTRRGEEKVRFRQEQLQAIAAELALMDALAGFEGDDRWKLYVSRIRERLRQVEKRALSASLTAEERAYYCGSLNELRLFKMDPEDMRHEREKLLRQATRLEAEIKRVQDRDGIWGEDPDL